jgi:hypothetical protein
MKYEKINGFFPDYTNDGMTIKKFWETLDQQADLEIHKNLVEFEKDKDLEKSIKRFVEVPLNFPDADITKEVINPYIDFLVDFSNKEESEVMDLYWKIYSEIFDTKF